MTVLAERIDTARQAVAHVLDRCPECLAIRPRRQGQRLGLFCSAAHRVAYRNRMIARGAKLAAPAMASRQTRQGTRGNVYGGAEATALVNRLIQRWSDEDKAEGRMSAADYFALRTYLGFNDCED